MEITDHLRLKKPAQTDVVDIDILNYNTDTLDTEVYKKQDKYVTRTVTLSVANWNSTNFTQSVTVTGVTASNDIDVFSAPANHEEYGQLGIYAISQAANSVTFKCKKIPDNNLNVYVRIWG